MIKKITSAVGTLGLLLSAAPAALADTITVVNDNTASISNSISVSSNSGGNASTGARGARGGVGGTANGGFDASSSIGGNGGAGGDGGAGGNISTGNAISTASVETEVNSSDIQITDNRSDANRFNETLRTSAYIGSTLSASYQSTDTHTESSSASEASNSASEYDEDGSATTGTTSSNSSSNEGSESSSSSASNDWDLSTGASVSGTLEYEDHDNTTTEYTRTTLRFHAGLFIRRRVRADNGCADLFSYESSKREDSSENRYDLFSDCASCELRASLSVQRSSRLPRGSQTLR